MIKQIDKISRNAGIYSLEHQKSGKVYVGQTKNLQSRLMAHDYQLKKGTHPNKNLQNAYNEDPRFGIKVLEEYDKHIDKRQLNIIEDLHILASNATDEKVGFNIKEPATKISSEGEAKEEISNRRNIIKNRQEKLSLTPVQRDRVERMVGNIERELNAIKGMLQISD